MIQLEVSVGDVVVELTPVLHIFGSKQKIDDQVLRDAIDFGEQRTFTQDPKYAIRLLVDIAIRALSPAINDPTTATQALDQIGDLMVRLGLRRIEIGTFSDNHGVLRVVVPYPSWDDFLELAFGEISYYGANSMQVMRRMNAMMSDLKAALPETRRPAVLEWQRRIQNTIARSFEDAEERQMASREDRQGLGATRRNNNLELTRLERARPRQSRES